MDILLLIDVLPFNNSGLTLRLVKVFEKLSQSHKIHFFYIGNAEFVQENLDILNKFCTSINKVPLKKKDFLLGRILNVLLLKHGAYVKYRFKKIIYRLLRRSGSSLMIRKLRLFMFTDALQPNTFKILKEYSNSGISLIPIL